MGRHGEQLCRTCDGRGVETLLFPTNPPPAGPTCQGRGRVSQTVARGMRWKNRDVARRANRPEGKPKAFWSPQLGLVLVPDPVPDTEQKSGPRAAGAESQARKVGA